MHPMLTIARRAGEEAGRFLQRAYRDLKKIQVQEKGRGDFVSAVDKTSEELIRKVLLDKYPHHAILGEELGGALDFEAEEFLWVIDPLDGTANFVHGLPHFAVSIALLKHGVPELALVYDPMRDDLFTAVRGEGAVRNGLRIRANGLRDSNKGMVATGFPYKDARFLQVHMAQATAVLEQFSDLRRLGSAALDLCYVACGWQDAYFERLVRPWDIAAGVLIAQEAGCLLSDYQGGKEMFVREEVVCANAYLQPVLLKILQDAQKGLSHGVS